MTAADRGLTWFDLDTLVEGDPLDLRDRAWAEIEHLRAQNRLLERELARVIQERDALRQLVAERGTP